jgi:hypothetical protein
MADVGMVLWIRFLTAKYAKSREKEIELMGLERGVSFPASHSHFRVFGVFRGLSSLSLV